MHIANNLSTEFQNVNLICVIMLIDRLTFFSKRWKMITAVTRWTGTPAGHPEVMMDGTTVMCDAIAD